MMKIGRWTKKTRKTTHFLIIGLLILYLGEEEPGLLPILCSTQVPSPKKGNQNQA
jgi:hypothetical protein